MPELLRSIAGRLRVLVGNRRRAKRYRVRVRAAVTLLDPKATGDGREAALTPPLDCHTCDISATGLGLVVPSIRVGERYLTGDGRLLRVALELPSGPLVLRALPVRYERLEEGPETGYLVGARLTQPAAADLARLDDFLKKQS